MRLALKIIGLCLALFFTNCKSSNDKRAEVEIDLTGITMCGTVQFSDGCSPQLDSLISFGLALVHHMTFDDAELVFNEVKRIDPDCFWGHWGVALTYIHPLWPDQPSDPILQKGWALSQKALELAESEKQKLYGQALAAYYENGLEKVEKERLIAYGAAWESAARAMPDDLEAELFDLLLKLAILSPTQPVSDQRLALGKRAERVLETIPDHPGGFHYAIHAYDHPDLAHHAIRVAREYSSIAPQIPHALHMPTHIFTRLGHWQESIDWNQKSAVAALKLPAGDKISLHYFHALDYIVYATLQQGNVEYAKEINDQISQLDEAFQPNPATAYALAAIPSRVALEQKNWDNATHVNMLGVSNFPWDEYPAYQALTYYGVGLGSARLGNADKTDFALAKLDSLKTKLNKTSGNEYWAGQIEIQMNAVQAWKHFTSGDKKKALELMHLAADIEDKTDKNPVTPGELLPARELLGDMYMELDQPAEASKHYQKCLERSPNRLNSLYGAGYAEELAGNAEVAKSFYNKLLEITKGKSSGHENIAHARRYLSET